MQNASMNIKKHEYVAILGPNGSGKSTIFKAIFGLAKILDGQIIFKNVDITGLRGDLLTKLGLVFVPQLRNVFTSMTVEENLEIGLSARKGNQKGKIDEIYDFFPILRQRRNQKAGLMSGGERQILALAKALLSNPELLILDEPTAGLSPKAATIMMQHLQELRNKGYSVVIIEQNVKRALGIADRAYVLAAGKIIFEGTVDDLVSNRELTKLYLGIIR